MSTVTNIFEVITSLVVAASVIYLVVLFTLAATCLVHFWFVSLLPSKKVWAYLSLGNGTGIIQKIDEDIAKILKEASNGRQG